MDTMAQTEGRQQRTARYATILGAFVTAASMVFGVLTYQRSAAEQRQTIALSILQDYLKLAVEHPDLASRDQAKPVDAKYNWFAMHALFSAETLWSLVGDDAKWHKAIDSILRQHRGYLEQGVFVCDDFQSGFVEYLKNRLPTLKCA